MIYEINSKHILDFVFSFLEEKKKLKLIIHCKKVQNILDIDLDLYKKVSGIRRSILKNGEIKDYSLKTNKLIYSGILLNGKRNGKGKEYDEKTGQIKFDGSYKNGEKHGKAKECEYYSNKNKLVFEGEYLIRVKNSI